MATVFTVQAQFTGDASSLQSATSKASASLSSYREAMAKLGDATDNLGNKIGNTLANSVVGAGRTIADFVKQTAGYAEAIGAAGLAAGVGFFNAASRVQELDVAMQAVAKSSGVTYEAISGAAEAVKKQGIEMTVAQELATNFAREQLNLADASKIARVAQDFAVISGQNSTAVTAELLDAITTQNSEVLRQAGVLGTAADAYAAYSVQTGIAVNAMTEVQKKQAIVNLILDQGTRIAGTYEAAMGTASKVLRSMPRVLNDISVSLGTSILDGFGPAVVQVYHLMAAFDDAIDEGGKLRPIITALSKVISELAAPITTAIAKMTDWISNLEPSQGVIDAITGSFSKLSSVAPLIASLGAGIAAFGANSIPIIGQFLPAINPLVAAFVGLAATSPSVRKALDPLYEDFKENLPLIQSAFKYLTQAVQTGVIPALAGLITQVRPLIPILIQLASNLVTSFTDTLPTIIALAKDLVAVLIPVFQWIAQLPEPVIDVAAAFIGLQAAGVPIAGILQNIAGQMVNAAIEAFGLQGAIDAVKGAMATVGDFMSGPWGIAIGAAIAVLGTLALSAFPQAAKNADELTGSLNRQTGAFTDATKASVLHALQLSGANKAAESLGISISDLVDGIINGGPGLDSINKQLDIFQNSINSISPDAWDNMTLAQQQSMQETAGAIQEVQEAIGQQSAAVKGAKQNNQEWLQVSGAAGKAQKDLATAISNAGDAIKTNGVNLDKTTAAWKSNYSALQTAGKAAKDYITTAKNQGLSQKEVNKIIGESVDNLLAVAHQMGLTGESADKYVAKLLGIPESKVTQIDADAHLALNVIKSIEKALHTLDNYTVVVKGVGTASNAFANGGFVNAMANGGMVHAADSLMRNSQIKTGGNSITWGEPETGWEAYISGKPAARQRSIDIWAQTGKKLGVMGDSSQGSEKGGVTLKNYFTGQMDPEAVGEVLLAKMRFATG